jgi:DNA-binding MurR/RpiR family transcriptional regulator
MTTTLILETLRRSLASLTPAEKKVARTLIARYPAAGLAGVVDLASRADTSTATVIRLVQRLGFEGFASFHAALLVELTSREAGPRDRLTTTQRPGKGSLATLSAALAESVASISTSVPASEYDATVALLCNPSRRIITGGGRVSQAWAELFATYLTRLRRDVAVFSRDPGRRIATLLDVNAKTIVVLFDFRRYDQGTVRIAEEAHRRRATVVLITDRWLSPAASSADVVLPVPVDVPSPFDTGVTSLALVECLTWSVTQELGVSGEARMKDWDAIAAASLGQGS